MYSLKLNKYYTGYTSNIENRLEYHNSGKVTFTSRGMPWQLCYIENYKSELEAIRKEREIKRKKSRRYIEELIEQSRKAG